MTRNVLIGSALFIAACASSGSPTFHHDFSVGADLSIPDEPAVDLKRDDLITTHPDLADADGGGTMPGGALLLNEVNERITGGQDRIELVALQAGSLNGFTINLGITTVSPAVTPTLLVTLPALDVQAGDLIVVHLNPGGGITTETNAGGMSGCADATCSSASWDVAGAAQDLTDSARVLTLNAPGGAIVDGLAYTNGSGPASWPAQLQALQAAGGWDPTPCPNACAKADADTLAVATGTSATGVQTNFAGSSMQRIDSITPSGKSHWTIKASTWGAAN